MKKRANLPVLIAAGILAGIAIAAVDNFVFGGEVSPIVIVAMLLVSGATFGACWGSRAAIAAAFAWICSRSLIS